MNSKNKTTSTKQKANNKYLNETINKCPKCKKQELIEFYSTEENTVFDFCLNSDCGYKKEKKEESEQKQ